MKKLIVVALTLLVMMAAVNPVFAAGGPRGTFALAGKISAVDAVAGTVTVTVASGNILVKPFLKQDVVIHVTSTTRYLYKSSATAVATAIKFTDLKVGDAVSVNGTVTNSVWTASRVTVGASLSCLP